MIKAVTLKGDVLEGNDQWFANVKPLASPGVITEIQFDLSSLQRGLTDVVTQKGNS